MCVLCLNLSTYLPSYLTYLYILTYSYNISILIYIYRDRYLYKLYNISNQSNLPTNQLSLICVLSLTYPTYLYNLIYRTSVTYRVHVYQSIFCNLVGSI